MVYASSPVEYYDILVIEPNMATCLDDTPDNTRVCHDNPITEDLAETDKRCGRGVQGFARSVRVQDSRNVLSSDALDDDDEGSMLLHRDAIADSFILLLSSSNTLSLEAS